MFSYFFMKKLTAVSIAVCAAFATISVVNLASAPSAIAKAESESGTDKFIGEFSERKIFSSGDQNVDFWVYGYRRTDRSAGVVAAWDMYTEGNFGAPGTMYVDSNGKWRGSATKVTGIVMVAGNEQIAAKFSKQSTFFEPAEFYFDEAAMAKINAMPDDTKIAIFWRVSDTSRWWRYFRWRSEKFDATVRLGDVRSAMDWAKSR